MLQTRYSRIFLVLCMLHYRDGSAVLGEQKEELLIITVATEVTDGFQRYLRSARINGLNGKVLGMGEEWLGGDMNHPGGGFKVNLLKKELSSVSDRSDLIVLFTDSYDVIFTAGAKEILAKYKRADAGILFGAEGFCWPDARLKEKYPQVTEGYRYVNSGGFIGTAKNVYEMITSKEIENDEDDQLFYTQIFLDEELRNKWNIKLDTRADIFQNLHGSVSDVELRFDDNAPYLANTALETKPIVIHGNGPTKLILNSLGNYLPQAWNKEDHCILCWEDNLSFQDLKETPQVVLAIFLEQPTPFLEEFFELIDSLDYPKNKVDLFIHNAHEYNTKYVEAFLEKANSEHESNNEISGGYNSVTRLVPSDRVRERDAREAGIKKCAHTKCDFYFSVDGDARLDNVHTLKLLIEQNRAVVAPMLVRPYKAWSNFWGALTSEGFYARSTDYMDIVQNNRRGLWNVPFISGCYLIKGELIHSDKTRPSFSSDSLDPDMAFCNNLREVGTFFYLSNRLDWGHLVNSDDFDTSHTHNELWEISNNQWDWEQRYLHENYSLSLAEDAVIQQPCPDVYWFPIVTERYADELVAEMEAYGKWSDGTNNDPRLDGGYENVPTRDIHMNQVDYEKEWLRFLDAYVRPLQETVFIGYLHSDSRIEGGYEAVPTRDIHMKQINMEEGWLEFLRLYVKPLVESIFMGFTSDPPRSIMNFVVRYRPDEQPFLRPHHDASTYTINIALNHAGKDYQGGGCNFLRYNCSVPNTKKGWMLMHPGRLTHYHEGLRVTEGTRYIMISFVDP